MSSHREAPEISKDPVADSTDVYAFVSPDRKDTVTLIANYIPFQKPDGGPNFFEFGDDVRYEIHVSNKGTAQADVTYRFEFTTQVRNKSTFLYNIGPIAKIDDPNWNRPQFYTLTRIQGKKKKVLATGLRLPAGQRRHPQHTELRRPGRPGGARPAQRREGLRRTACRRLPRRPRQHLRPRSAATVQQRTPRVAARDGRDQRSPGLQRAHAGDPGADQGPRGWPWQGPCGGQLRHRGVDHASRQKSRVFDSAQGKFVGHGPYKQVSRLGNPLFNEVLIPMADKDYWNSRPPSGDARYTQNVGKPELAGLLPVALPGRVPQAQGLHQAASRPRRDPAHGHPVRRGPRVPELHRRHQGGHGAAQRRDPADQEGELARPGGRRRGRLPERATDR